MFTEHTSVGLDVHARSVVAAALDTETGVTTTARLTPSPAEVLAWVRALPGPVAVCYEAGPTGYGLARACTAAGVRCVVAAPSKIVRPAGDRVKTDAKDAQLLARLLRMDQLTAVRVPTEAEEAALDLVRAREDARSALMAARHRLSKLVLRHGYVYSGGVAWTGAHERWLRAIRFERAGTQAAFDTSVEDVVFTTGRRDQLDRQIAELAAASEFTPVVNRLCCLRGIATLTGFALAVEIGDWTRFNRNSIGAYLGLAPGEASSGDKRVVTAITKAGNSHVRRLLSESAWRHKPAYQPGTTLLLRWAKAPGPVVALAHQGNNGSMPAGWASRPGTKSRRSRTPRSPASWPVGAGAWSPCKPRAFAHDRSRGAMAAHDSGVTREGHYEAAYSAVSSLDSGSALVAEQPVMR